MMADIFTYRISNDPVSALGTCVIMGRDGEDLRFADSVEHARAWCRYLNADRLHSLAGYGRGLWPRDYAPYSPSDMSRVDKCPSSVDLMTTSAEAKRRSFAKMYGGGSKFGRR